MIWGNNTGKVDMKTRRTLVLRILQSERLGSPPKTPQSWLSGEQDSPEPVRKDLATGSGPG